MKDSLTIHKYIPATPQEVFSYLTRPELLEQWAAPEGMSLKVPYFEANPYGKYRFEHTGSDGLYLCTGYVKEIIPDHKLVQVDTVKDPKGKIIFQHLESTVTLKEHNGGTDISVTQTGFQDQEGMRACEEGWNQSLGHLNNLFSAPRPPADFTQEQGPWSYT